MVTPLHTVCAQVSVQVCLPRHWSWAIFMVAFELPVKGYIIHCHRCGVQPKHASLGTVSRPKPHRCSQWELNSVYHPSRIRHCDGDLDKCLTHMDEEIFKSTHRFCVLEITSRISLPFPTLIDRMGGIWGQPQILSTCPDLTFTLEYNISPLKCI